MNESCKNTATWAVRLSRAQGIVLCVAGALCLFAVGCSGGDAKQQQKSQAAAPRAISVATASVQKQDVPVYLSGLGAVTAFNTANIKSRVDGQIMKVNVQEGQNVTQGELLIEIDARPYQAVSYTHLRAHETDSYLVCR